MTQDTHRDSVAPASEVPSRDLHERLNAQRRILARLSRSDALTRGDIMAAYSQATEFACELLNVERASVWHLSADQTRIELVDLFERSPGRHSAGVVIEASRAPEYFKALAEERSIAAHRATSDPRTREFADWYLEPLGIEAMLDAPVFVRGHMVGVVCHEHVGPPRHWDFWEELLAGTVADFAAMVAEAAERERTERELGEYRSHLRELVSLKSSAQFRISAELERDLEVFESVETDQRHSEAGLRTAFEASGVAIAVTRISDSIIYYANQRAEELFESSGGELVGKSGADFYENPIDRLAFLAQITETGRVDGMVVRLRTEKKRPFWAMASAQKVRFGDTDAVMLALTDVTAQKLAEEAIRRSEEGIRTLFAAAPVALVLSRIADNKVVLANRRAADLFEVPLEEAVGQEPPNFWVNPQERHSYLEKVREQGFVDNFTAHMQSRHGRIFWALLSARIVEFEGQPCLLGGVTDVSAQKALEEQLRDLATKDSLTEAYNRRHFLERAEEELRRAERHQRALSLCMIDADHFKTVNDQFGHAAGDVVLRELARICRSHLRANDILARVGGEEFTLLLPETPLSGAQVVAERIRVELGSSTMRSPEGRALRITASFGVAEWQKGENLDDLLRRADRALYAAKDAGRNRVVVDGEGG